MNKGESADLIMKLYDLRREPTMREARNWFVTFMPESAEEVVNAVIDEKTSPYYRMVLGYWDMAASFVIHGAIDEEMFNDANGEHIMVFCKIEPYLEELRKTFKFPKMLANLETLIMNMPDAKALLAERREMIQGWVKARTAQGLGMKDKNEG
jgi:hypothetical protein